MGDEAAVCTGPSGDGRVPSGLMCFAMRAMRSMTG
eukprot:CAMPEP_0175392086 /NCGR_PEP_ID=MMETSP0095-20121207/32243_1 /TAXON_ID=311494 /ORGANISM="Alexandrium monilatum, Strain CCMP3105" /LENGTH=34 /DNA_ID= /DNA_START= /DNA_END= /DNA_ORIENTATION=